MITFIESHRSELEALCRKYRVSRLEVLGSVARGGFGADHSDLDFVVKFETDAPMGSFRQYVDFLLELERLFGRRVDLVELDAVTNPYFLRAVNATRRVVYAA